MKNLFLVFLVAFVLAASGCGKIQLPEFETPADTGGKKAAPERAAEVEAPKNILTMECSKQVSSGRLFTYRIVELASGLRRITVGVSEPSEPLVTASGDKSPGDESYADGFHTFEHFQFKNNGATGLVREMNGSGHPITSWVAISNCLSEDLMGEVEE